MLRKNLTVSPRDPNIITFDISVLDEKNYLLKSSFQNYIRINTGGKQREARYFQDSLMETKLLMYQN